MKSIPNADKKKRKKRRRYSVKYKPLLKFCTSTCQCSKKSSAHPRAKFCCTHLRFCVFKARKRKVHTPADFCSDSWLLFDQWCADLLERRSSSLWLFDAHLRCCEVRSSLWLPLRNVWVRSTLRGGDFSPALRSSSTVYGGLVILVGCPSGGPSDQLLPLFKPLAGLLCTEVGWS